ncbi:MAG: hypothetical protein V7672_06445 [Brevundimonas sp.]|jgi:hypothetical protein|uniref:hypothetical protein n=1 Tax=Brevundimonas sp. TaxID=1871086 RepID=UPI003001E6DD
MTSAATDHRTRPRSRETWRKDDVRKAVEGALAGGLPIGRIDFRRDSFSLIALDDSHPASEAERCARLMEDAFSEGGSD